ncbi:hypothetical protein SLS58_009200 [Diplodia intermedia]|uniref:Uncharacterized protein n=1 Tax=Diplodia intermedia TaxID=856260 RepID=A0ABR3TDN8_9PEZI
MELSLFLTLRLQTEISKRSSSVPSNMKSLITNEQPVPCIIRACRYSVSCLKPHDEDGQLEMPFEVTTFLNRHLLSEIRRLDQRSMATTLAHETLRESIKEQFQACKRDSIRSFVDSKSVAAALINATAAICDLQERFVEINPSDFEIIWDDYDIKWILRGFDPEVKSCLAAALETKLLNTPPFIKGNRFSELCWYESLLSTLRTVLLSSVDDSDVDMVEEAQNAALALTPAISRHICVFV